jgi:hypothetical protein
LWSVDGVTWHDAGKVALKFGERTMAGPVAWGAASKEPVEVRFADLVVDGLFGAEPVPSKVLATTGPDPEDMDADGLPDAWERLHGIDPAVGKGPDGAGGDPDGDRLSHARELTLGGDPRKAGGIPGSLSRERWDGIPAAPEPPRFERTPLREEVAREVEERFGRHPGRLDVDALRVVSEGVNRVKEETGLGVLLITHYTRILRYIKPDFVHVFVNGRIAEEGGPALADRLEAEGYDRFTETADA